MLCCIHDRQYGSLIRKKLNQVISKKYLIKKMLKTCEKLNTYITCEILEQNLIASKQIFIAVRKFCNANEEICMSQKNFIGYFSYTVILMY